MKNTSIIINVVLGIAVIILYVLHFMGNPGSPAASENAAGLSKDGLSIAYVNSDSLLKNYDYFKDLEKQFNEKRDKLNAEYQNRGMGLQREIQNFQATAGNMTQNQARAVQEDLQKKQQNLMMYQEQLGQQLMQEEARMNTALYDKVADYLREYGLNKNLQIVLTYTKGSGVLYANDNLDITNEIMVGLNEAYKTEVSSGTAGAAADTTKIK
ncbi:MAG: OmpH family outer membrane protein [Cyclobacteriaceae bacterium]|nr:OmpH family outer membrane protein [Cyclobacteriaceae bacterium]